MIVHAGAGKEIVLRVEAFGVPDGDPITLMVRKVGDGDVACPWAAPARSRGDDLVPPTVSRARSAENGDRPTGRTAGKGGGWR